MKLVINKDKYDMKNGVGLLKTLYENDYNAIPEELKHEQLKGEWDKYQGISKKLYQMSKSEDVETLELCVELLNKEGVEHQKNYMTSWQTVDNEYKSVRSLRSIDVFTKL